MPLLETSDCLEVFQMFKKLIDTYKNYRNFSISEDIFIFENLKNGSFEQLKIPNKRIYEIIFRYIDIKQKYHSLKDKDILAK